MPVIFTTPSARCEIICRSSLEFAARSGASIIRIATLQASHAARAFLLDQESYFYTRASLLSVMVGMNYTSDRSLSTIDLLSWFTPSISID